ncbi:MAG: hypothetical protein QM755_18315 [Luteolibacter sp.]
MKLDPYRDSGVFTYDRELTGKAFNTLRQFVRIACIDSHDEMQRAWKEMAVAGFPDEAMKVFLDVSAFPYAEFGKGHPVLDGGDPLTSAEFAATLGARFRGKFKKAGAIARESSHTTTR